MALGNSLWSILPQRQLSGSVHPIRKDQPAQVLQDLEVAGAVGYGVGGVEAGEGARWGQESIGRIKRLSRKNPPPL